MLTYQVSGPRTSSDAPVEQVDHHLGVDGLKVDPRLSLVLLKSLARRVRPSQ